jgi:hypothetical protein
MHRVKHVKRHAMSLWKIEVYAEEQDTTPFRVGYLSADTEYAAVEAAIDAMGEAERSDVNVVARMVSSLPPDVILWVPDNA